MNVMLRMALQMLIGFIILFVCIQAASIVAVRILWPDAASDGSSINKIQIYILVLCAVLFLLTLLLIGWYLGKPVYFAIVWLRRLAEGNYESPARWAEIHTRKNGSPRLPYAVYRELFDHLELLAHTLEQNNKEKMLSEQMRQEWIRGISHDLKTPLTYISGYSSMLSADEYRWSEEERKEFLSVIHRKAAHLQELVQDLNETVSNEIPLKTEETDIAELLRRTVADVGSAPWAAGYSFTMESVSIPVAVPCDPKLLTRAIRNLLVNAVVHNPEGTEISVSVQVYRPEQVEIRIVDNGIGFGGKVGMNDTRAASAGRPGLGLTIARQLIEAHGGQLTIDSEPNEGTSLTIKLPRK
ncbi:sensor histidine kinase [Paenibacillus humicola]|uniref:sensor histidine kinase n=1 Tax=Paenibacillus humicola TaxID=3110540 RepID=UPI00237AA4FD|nr:HAMP domain-containing sensor histidine kinase [Paenibacillus humicola]